MITKINQIKEIPMRLFVSAQTSALERREQKTGGTLSAVLPKSQTDRRAMAFGAALSTVAYTLTVQALAAEGDSGFKSVIQTFTSFAIYLLAAGSFIMAIAAALMFVTAAGNPKMIQRGKDTIKYVVLGIMLMAAFWAGRDLLLGIADPGGKDGGVGEKIKEKQDAQQQSTLSGK